MALSTLRAGSIPEATKLLEAITIDEAVPRHQRDKALEALGDIAVLGGDEPRAALRYAEVMSRLVDEDALRTLEVKMGAAKDPRARPGIIALLIGTPPRAPDKVRAATLLAEWGMIAPDDGLPQYLIARQYMATNELEQAGERLDASLGEEALDSPRRDRSRAPPADRRMRGR